MSRRDADGFIVPPGLLNFAALSWQVNDRANTWNGDRISSSSTGDTRQLGPVIPDTDDQAGQCLVTLLDRSAPVGDKHPSQPHGAGPAGRPFIAAAPENRCPASIAEWWPLHCWAIRPEDPLPSHAIGGGRRADGTSRVYRPP
ncbi:hypothetical protein CDD83_10713 [Cordyceps sp. RAO-2017]|nr:hypothetical protein CDD83_10713 [Cordyceps sp. RAO-2017]